MKRRQHFDKKLIRKIRNLKKRGLTQIQIARKLNIRNASQVNYWLNTKKRRRYSREYARKHYKENRERWLARNRKWNAEHYNEIKRSQCLSLIKLCLREKIITRKDIEYAIKLSKKPPYAVMVRK